MSSLVASLCTLLAIAAAGCRGRAVPAQAVTSLPIPAHGDARVLSADQAPSLAFCSAPGLRVSIRLDSVITPTAAIAMGTAELAAGAVNIGVHRDTDEAIYFLTSGGRAFVAADTVAVQSGLMLYVPRGVTHGFWSPADEAMRFLWVNYPQALAQSFRARGVTPGAACPPRRTP